jgi:Stage II sporulation protein E (SpoIIE)
MRTHASVARAAVAVALFCLLAVTLLAGAAAAAPAEAGKRDGAAGVAEVGAPDSEAPDSEAPDGATSGDGDSGSGGEEEDGDAGEPAQEEPEAEPAESGESEQPDPDAGATGKPGDEGKPDKPDKPEPDKPDKPDKPDDDEDEGSVQVPVELPVGGSATPGTTVESAKDPPAAVPTAPLPVNPAVPTPRAQNRSRGQGGRTDRPQTQDGPGAGSRPGAGGGSAPARSPAGGRVADASASRAPSSTASRRAAAEARVAEQQKRERAAAEAERLRREAADEGSPVTRTVTRTVNDIVEVVPDSMKAALAALAALAVLLGGGYLFSTVRARRLARQRRELLSEVGLLQGALLPSVPAALGGLRTSVAYRPADGPGAGGDFYDVLPLTGGRVGFILGDVSGHGRSALERTAFMRYTLRAYLEAGLEPRVALQVADRVIDENLGGDFATVILAVHDPETGSLTYASAGHPAPIITGAEEYEPVTASSSPPIGVGVRTGLRQTTVPLEPGAVACFYTDGLSEARTDDGIMGRWRLAKLVSGLGRDANAEALLDRVAQESRLLSDDMAACLITPTSGVTAGGFRTEQLEVSAAELDGPVARRFLDACGVSEADTESAEQQARAVADQFGGAVLHVVLGNRCRVEVLPRNVESIEAASRRSAAR